MKYKYKLWAIFSVLFLLLFSGVIAMKISSEQNYKRSFILARLDGYADILAQTDDYQSIHSILPKDLRITILSKDGVVVYDSYEYSNGYENHIQRPEIKDCLRKGTGNAIRTSATSHQKNFYYAKRVGNNIIRVAQPFEMQLRDFFRPDWIIFITILLVFLVLWLCILLLVGRYNKKNKEAEEKRIRLLKQQMTNNISHELKTPVSSIRGYLETLSEYPDLDAERRQLFVERSYLQTLRLSELLNDISIINKIEEAPEQFSVEEVNLFNIVNEITEEFSQKIVQNKQSVENMLPVDLTVSGNYGLLYSLFRNLMENSVKYGGEGCELCVECSAVGDKFIHLVYYDTGKGVPDQYLHKIFDRFFRVDEGRDSHAGGSGLGLSIVKNSVAFHHGSISAHNREEGGLTFFFTLAKKLSA
ncbi:MAG: ATP-binding protein [Bacteroidales bacterium]|nr:ATP-binding protein [Bacteroidales bacterium]